MHDDREQFEQDQILRDRELTDEEIQWIHDQNEGLDRALARIGAEVAAHGPGWTGADQVEAGQAIRLDITPGECQRQTDMRTAPAVTELRFGDRLLIVLGDMGRVSARQLREIAVAINRDAKRQRDEEAERLGYVRTRVEEAVEQLSFAIIGGHSDAFIRAAGDPPPTKSVVESERLLAEFDVIFGKRPEEEPASSLVVAPVERRHRPDCKVLRGGWTCDCGYPTEAEWLSFERDRRATTEPEPAHDRRERESARYEDRSGRVDGVDR